MSKRRITKKTIIPNQLNFGPIYIYDPSIMDCTSFTSDTHICTDEKNRTKIKFSLSTDNFAFLKDICLSKLNKAIEIVFRKNDFSAKTIYEYIYDMLIYENTCFIQSSVRSRWQSTEQVNKDDIKNLSDIELEEAKHLELFRPLATENLELFKTNWRNFIKAEEQNQLHK